MSNDTTANKAELRKLCQTIEESLVTYRQERDGYIRLVERLEARLDRYQKKLDS